MTTDRIDVDDLLRDLSQALTVEPAQHFETRARVHLLKRRRADRRAIFLGLVVVGAIAVAIVVTPRMLLDDVLADVPRIAREMPVSLQVAEPPVVSESRSSVAVARGVVGVDQRTFAFEVIVPDDQRRELRKLLQMAYSGRMVAAAEESPFGDEITGELLPPAPIVVLPLAPIPPLEGSEGGAGRSR